MHELPRREDPTSIPPGSPRTLWKEDSETTVEEGGPQASPQPPRGRATSRASTSRDSRAHRHRKVTREEATLHNLPPRRPGPWAPRHGARAGPCRASLSEEAGRRDPWKPAAAPPAAGGGGRSPGMRVAAEGGAGEAGRGGGRARRGPGSPGSRPAACAQRAPRGSSGPPRGAACLVPCLVALCGHFASPATDMVLEDAPGRLRAGIRRRRSRAGGPSRAARCPGRRSSCRRQGLAVRGADATRDAAVRKAPASGRRAAS